MSKAGGFERDLMERKYESMRRRREIKELEREERLLRYWKRQENKKNNKEDLGGK